MSSNKLWGTTKICPRCGGSGFLADPTYGKNGSMTDEGIEECTMCSSEGVVDREDI